MNFESREINRFMSHWVMSITAAMIIFITKGIIKSKGKIDGKLPT